MIRFVLLAVALLVAACGGTAAPSITPTAGASSAPSTGSVSATARPTPAKSTSPSFAPILPGESWLLYAWFPDTLYLVRPDGSDKRPLDLGVPGTPGFPSWSPDGERIAFVMRDSTTPNGSIWTANADGSDAAFLYGGEEECNQGAFWPSWSPDGGDLALICYRAEGDEAFSEVSVLDPASGERKRLVALRWPESVQNAPSWSPDGSTLTVEVSTWDPTDTFVTASLIATVGVASGKMTALTDPSLFASHPDWSPDGALIAFNTYDTGTMHGIQEPSNVYLIAPDGTGLRQLSTASTDGKMRLGQPFWSADGTRIWVSVARDWEKDSNNQFRNTLGWVDASTGEFHEVGTEGKRFRERPQPIG